MTARFEEEIGLIKKVITDFGDGHRSNLAIISDPFFGESELMDRVEGMAGKEGERINAGHLIRNFDLLATAPGKIVMVEEAHRLYRRKIGGFDLMNRFLKMITCSDRLFITSWNSYSWEYLDEVLELGRFFPQRIRLSKMSADEIREMLLSSYEEDELTFLQEEIAEGEQKILGWHLYKRTLAGINLNIPLPEIDVELIRSRLDRTEKKSAEDIFFERLGRISDGNPGVAEQLWKDALAYPEVRNDLKEPNQIDLDRDGSFALGIILFMKSVEMEYLSDVLEALDLSAENIANRLEDRGLVKIDGEVVTLRVEALKGIAEHLKRLRLVW